MLLQSSTKTYSEFLEKYANGAEIQFKFAFMVDEPVEQVVEEIEESASPNLPR